MKTMKVNVEVNVEMITASYGVTSVSLQNLANKPTLRTSFAAVWTNHIVMKNCFQQQEKSYRNA